MAQNKDVHKKLSEELEKYGLKEMSIRALGGYYSDFESPLATPKVQLVKDLQAEGHHALAKRVMNGEFDG